MSTTTDGQGAIEEQRERYQTDTRQPHSYVGFVTQEEHIDKLRHLEARVRREVAAEYVSLMVAHDTALTELISLRAEVAAQRPVVAAVARDFGQQLRAARLERGFTQRDAAVWLGLSPQFYNDMEHGRRTPGDDLADRIEERFGVVYLTPRMARLLALARATPDAGESEGGLPARGTPAWDAEYQAACDSRSWDMCELLQDQPWATPDAQQGE